MVLVEAIEKQFKKKTLQALQNKVVESR